MKFITFLYIFVLSISFVRAQTIITKPFDKIKWNNSGEYRYDLILRSFEIIDDEIIGSNEVEIIKKLGKPFNKIIKTEKPVVRLELGWTTVDTVIDLTYCLDIYKKKRSDSLKICNGSYMILHLFKDSLVDVTIVNVEPKIEAKKIPFNKKEFYLSGWIYEFPDSINVYGRFNEIPKNQKYSHLKSINKRHFDLYMWTGEIQLETPTQLKDKLKIKVYEEKMIFILGNKRKKYEIINQNYNMKLIKTTANNGYKSCRE